jgi:tetratricopeptide (TPR) repeat protein
MDGERWQRLTGRPKAWTLAGSRASWPIGWRDAVERDRIALCEGGPDALACLHHAFASGVDTEIGVVCMIGAACRIPPECLASFNGKRVRVFVHADAAGLKAAQKWAAQLIEAASGAILWTQKFDRPLTDLAALQEALVGEVAAHLGTQFFRLEMEQALKKPGDLSAWECVMRAQAALRQMTPETMALAGAESARAVAIAPDYGLAHAMLANSLALANMYLSRDNLEELRRIRFHIDRALICDGENAAVLGQVADALANTDWPTEGLQRARRAIEISPGHGYAYFAAMIAAGKLGFVDDALAYFADFRRIEPDSPYQHYAYTWSSGFYLQKGDLASAEAACDYTLAQNPSGPTGHLLKAVIASLAGRAGEARDRIREVGRHEPDTALGMWELRLQRWWPTGPALDAMLAALRALWPAMED